MHACLDPLATPPPRPIGPLPVLPKPMRGLKFPAPDPPQPPVRPFGILSVDPDTRRDFALCSRLARRSQAETAALVGVSQSTISRDLAKWRREGVPDSNREPAVEIGWAMALFDEVLRGALGDLHTLKGAEFDNVPGVRARMACRKTVLMVLATRTDLLRRVGLLRPGTVQRPPRGPSGEEIVHQMRAAGITPEWVRKHAPPAA